MRSSQNFHDRRARVARSDWPSIAEIAAVPTASAESAGADRDGCTGMTPPTSFGHALSELTVIKIC
jgi:hypothetical protein